MTERSRTVLIALGVSLPVAVIVPLLVCAGGMMGMGDTSGMMGDSGGMMMSGRPMIMGGITALVIAIAGAVLLVLGLRRS
jgi:hypothetical protein